jgi:hypothetical protein
MGLASLIVVLPHPLRADDELEPRGVLGVFMTDIPPGLEDVFGTPKSRGAFIVDGMPVPRLNSSSLPTSETDMDYLRSGDLVIEMDGMKILGTADMTRELTGKRPRQIVRLTVLRDGKETQLRCRLSEGPPLRYVPVDLCLVPSTGSFVGIAMLGSLFGVGPVWGLPYGSELTGCSHTVPACSALAVVRQDETRSVVEVGSANFQAGGDWRHHTHRTPEECQKEKAHLAALKELALTSAPRTTPTDTPSSPRPR